MFFTGQPEAGRIWIYLQREWKSADLSPVEMLY